MECLEEQIVMTKPVIPHTSSMGDYRPVATSRVITEAEHFNRWMDQVHDSLVKVNRVIDDKEVDMCVLEGHEERLKNTDTDLQGIKQDMLLVQDYDS